MADHEFQIIDSNFCAKFDPEICKFKSFRPWINFLNEQTNVRYAICQDVELNELAIRTFYLSAINKSTGDYQRLMFRVRQNEYIITEDDVNRILKFPTDNFVPDPTEDEVVTFLQFINYQTMGKDLNLGCIIKNNFPNEWRCFFDIISHVFSLRATGFHTITGFLQTIGYAVAHNRRINFGRLLLQKLLCVMGAPARRSLATKDVVCAYPRFIQLILDETLSNVDQLLFDEAVIIPCAKMTYKFFAHSVSNNRFPGVESSLTTFMQARFNQPPLADNTFINEHGEVVLPTQLQPRQVEEPNQSPPPSPLGEADDQDTPLEQPGHSPQGDEGRGSASLKKSPSM